MSATDTISIVINTDTRPGYMEKESVQGKQFEGTRSLDYFTDGVLNKANFFRGFKLQVILFVDVHEPLDKQVEDTLHEWHKEGKIDVLVLHRNNKTFPGFDYFPCYNDLNYLNALMFSRGKYVVHFDGDMAGFCKDSSVITDWINLLDTGVYDYISYPTPWSPKPDEDPRWDYSWVSTRFFMCKRSSLDYTEIQKCLVDPDYMYAKYGDKYHRCPWFEHVLGIMAGPDKVFYPAYDLQKYFVFSWSYYHSGNYEKLNRIPYEKVLEYVFACGGIRYPCDVYGTRLILK